MALGAAPMPDAAAAPPSLLDICSDDIAIAIASALPGATDLARLSLTCTRFATRCIAGPPLRTHPAGPAPAAADARPETWSIVEEAARRWLTERLSPQERGWVRQRGGRRWVALVREVEVLRGPLVFDRAHADVALAEGGAVATKLVSDGRLAVAAASAAVMRAGRHYAQFTLGQRSHLRWYLGVVPARWGVGEEGGRVWPRGAQGPGAFHVTFNRLALRASRQALVRALRTGRSVQGSQRGLGEKGDRIGVLLDLDQGSVSVYRDEERLGVMRAQGLRGEFCWAAAVFNQGCSTRIESAPAPPSPTPEELAAAKPWSERWELDLND